MSQLLKPLLTALTVLSLATAATAQTPVFTNDNNRQPYFSFSIDQDQLTGAPDRSDLNQALTPADKLFVRGSHFYRVGKDLRANTADDTRVRLYGVNLSFATNFPSEKEAVQLAKRLRKLGFNAVRLHHMDTAPGTNTAPPRSLLTPAPYPTFNQTALTRLSYFIRALAQEGLYVNINLHVSYSFRASVDRVPTFENNAENATYGTSVHVYYPRMVALQEEFARQLLRSLNLRNYPGLAMVEINNESSLLAAWQRREWKAAVPPNYEPELQQQWQAWLKQRYGSIQKACDTWGECIAVDGVMPLMSPTDNNYAPVGVLSQLQERIERQIKPFTQKVTGPTDPAKVDNTPYTKRRHDFMRFLADTDKAYLDRLRHIVKEETDALVPVTGTQMGYGGVLNFDSHAQMDYIDEHFYIDHPDYPGTAWDRNDWRMRDTPLNRTEFNRLLALSFHRDSKKPYVISEFNYPFPNRQSAVIQPLMAAVAAAQDWDGLFFYDYMDGDNWANTPTGFTLSGDWGKFALTGQSALLFRQAQFPALSQRTTISLPAASRVAIAASRDRGALAAHLLAKHGITPETASTAQLAIDLSETTAKPIPATPINAAASALTLNAQNILFLRTPQAKGVFGVLPGTPVTIDDTVAVVMDGQGRGYVALLLNALDNQPISHSRRIIVTVSGAVTGTQPGSSPHRPMLVTPYKDQNQWSTFEPDPSVSNKPSGARDVLGPVWIERTQLRLILALNQRQLTVYPLNSRGERLAALSAAQVNVKDGVATIDLQANEAQTSVWYEIVSTAP
jgi:hypothetical protein